MSDLRGDNYLYHLPAMVKDQALMLICGKELGRGVSRTVFEFAPDKTLVVKIEHNQARNQNASEYTFWEAVSYRPELARWFAGVHLASDMNAMILQTRTQPVTLAELKAKCPLVPAFMSDLKVGNWGRIGRRYVCHDYGTALIPERGFTTRMQRAKWWE